MSIIQAQIEPLIHLSNCFFGYFQGVCSYDPNNAPVFFSLGDAVASFGLIFAVFQLSKESWEIVFSIRESWQRRLFWYFGITGLVMVGFSAFIRQFPSGVLEAPYNYPILYELLGFIFFISAPASLFILGRRKIKQNKKKRAERFYQVLLSEIASPRKDNLEASVNIIGANIKEISKALKGVRWVRRMGKDDTPLSEDEIYASYAEGITSVILSDERVAKYIVTARLDFLLHFLSELKNNNISLEHTRFGLEKIFEALFQEKNSYFYSQLDYRGVSLAANVFEIILSDPYFITHFRVLGGAHNFGSYNQLSDKYLTVYFKALEYALKGFWKNNCPINMGQEICRAFRQIKEYSQSLAYATLQKDKAKEAISRLQKIESFLGHTYIWDYRDALKNNLVSDYEKDVTKSSNYMTSVNYAYAECVYEFIESLAIVKEEYDEQVRFIGITTTMETIGVNSQSDSDISKIQDVLIGLIWEKINGKFMSNEQGYFPAVLRVYLEMVGLEVGDGTSVAGQERKKLVEFLYKSIKPKILSGEKMANNKTTFEKGVLPKSIILNRTTGNFEYVMSGGSNQIMELKNNL